MAEESKQVTMTFNSYDDNNDNTLMFEGPMYVAAVLNNVSDLYTFNTSAYQDSDALIIYVRNVNSQDAVTKGEIPYRGSFYKYNWETGAWGQIVLGNHSHSNMAILDQLGEINTADMKVGEKKVLTIKKINYGDYQIKLTENGMVQWGHENSTLWHDWFKLEDKVSNYNHTISTDIITSELVAENLKNYYYYVIKDNKYPLLDLSGNKVRQKISNMTLIEPVFKIEDRKLYWRLSDETVWIYIRNLDEIRLNDTRVQWKDITFDYWTDIASTNDIIDNTRSTNLSSYQYKLEYEDIPESHIPEVKSSNTRQYLSADENGQFSWVDSFVPKQTFKLLKINVTNEFIGNTTSSKSITLSEDYLTTNSVNYKPEYNDEILVFDSGRLITDIAITYNNTLTITITNNNDSDLFEIGEVITILIIRSGIDGLIDNIQDQYMKKSEVIELLTNGTIHLNDFVTKKDLEDYAAMKTHSHSNYLTRNDYDAFDYRYADYQHTHWEYVTKADVISILLDSADDSGNIDTDGAIKTLVDQLQTYVNNKVSDYYTKEQTRTLVNSQVAQLKYTDAIEVSNMSGMSLTSYLVYLNNKVSQVSQVDADVVELESDVVNLGDDLASIGGWKNGEKIEKGKTTLTDFIHKLITKEVIPTLVEPELNISYTESNNDAGANNIFTYRVNFNKNDGGELTLLQLFIYKGEEVIEEYVINNNEENVLNLIMDAVDETNLCYKLEFIAEYSDGENKTSNIGKSYHISANKIVKDIYIYNERMIYTGCLQKAIDSLSTDDIYNSVYVSENSIVNKYKSNQENINFILKSENKVKSFFIAIPAKSDYELKEIIFRNQYVDIFEDCERLYLVDLRDAQGKTVNNINNKYNVWYYSFTNQIQTNIPLQFILSKKGE